MANSTITFFPVGDKNGGMTLLRLNDLNNTTILVDMRIGDELIAEHCDVNQELRDRLPTDDLKRPYVDSFILTHRHQDHLLGFTKHFHLDSLDNYPEEDNEKIIIRELWSNYLYKKKSSSKYELCDEAKAFNSEMIRRIKLFEDDKCIQEEGDRAIIIGKDSSDDSDSLDDITYEIESSFTMINNNDIPKKLEGYILGPLELQEDEDKDDFNDKNRQSIVLQLNIKQGDYNNKIMMTADAECLVWETLWSKYKNETDKLEYDILLAPHHCSWHSLSYDSQSDDDDPKICKDSKKALSQSIEGAHIISQSKPIKDEDQDPPSKAAKDEYLTIVDKEHFLCTNEHPNKKRPEPIEFNLTGEGPQKKGIREKSKLSTAALASTKEAYPHGRILVKKSA